jgi:soluble P-type ATPase
MKLKSFSGLTRRSAYEKYESDQSLATEEIPTPEDLSEEQKDIYRQIYASSNNRNLGFTESMADVISRSPELYKQFLEKHRHFTINTIGCLLANNPNLQSLSHDVLIQVLSLPGDEISSISQISHCLQSSNYKLTQEDVPELLDIAHTTEVIGKETIIDDLENPQASQASNPGYSSQPFPMQPLR